MKKLTTAAVDAAVAKVATQPTTFDYMTTELDARITNATVNAVGNQVLMLVHQGVPPAAATAAGNDMMLALAFHLGFLAGQEHQSSESFTDMMLGIGGFDGQAPDAGEPEHGSE